MSWALPDKRPKSNVEPLRHKLAWLPVAGVIAFVTCYFYAASLYPGGTRADHATRGYSHWSNYWCDLLDRVSYSGDVNAGRPFAVLATIVLPLSLMPLWIQAPLLFPEEPLARRIVRATGPAAMVLSALVFTSLHDLAINVASVLGFICFVATTLGLARSRRLALVGLGLIPLGLGLVNWVMWQTGWLLGAMPAIQKMSYVSFFSWVLATNRAIGRFVAASGNEGVPGNPRTSHVSHRPQ